MTLTEFTYVKMIVLHNLYPISFEYDEGELSNIGIKTAQGFAEQIDYCCVYRMSIVTIYAAKNSQ